MGVLRRRDLAAARWAKDDFTNEGPEADCVVPAGGPRHAGPRMSPHCTSRLEPATFGVTGRLGCHSRDRFLPFFGLASGGMITLPWGCRGGIAMKAVLLALPLFLCPALSSAQNGLVPPKVVRLESLQQDSEMKVITVGNAQKHYTLYCNVKADGCITPERGANYL